MGTLADHDKTLPKPERRRVRPPPPLAGIARASPVTREVFDLIMARFELTGAIQSACDACGIKLDSFHHAVGQNGWQDDYAASYRRFKDSLTSEMVRRARDGVLQPVYYKGEVVGEKREFSDRLLETITKAHDHRFREHGGASGAPSGQDAASDAFSLNLSDLSQAARDEVRLHLAAIRGIIEADVAAGTALIPPVDEAEMPVIDVEAE